MATPVRTTINVVVLGVVGAALGAGAVAALRGRISTGHGATVLRTSTRGRATTRTSTSETVATTTAKSVPTPVGSVDVPILMYHRVSDPAFSRSAIERSLTVSPRVFAQQLNWLHAHHYTTISQTQLAEAMAGSEALPPRPVMITFDDGYVDISNTVLPLMRRRRMKGTAYVITDRVFGTDRAFMKVAALKRIEAGGIEVGSHSASHMDLTQLSDDALRRELEGSRKALELRLGHPVPWFCYPSGQFNDHVEEMARTAGYLLATTTEPGSVHDRARPLALSRVRISNETGVDGLAAALA